MVSTVAAGLEKIWSGARAKNHGAILEAHHAHYIETDRFWTKRFLHLSEVSDMLKTQNTVDILLSDQRMVTAQSLWFIHSLNSTQRLNGR